MRPPQERREYYHQNNHLTQEEILRKMDFDELKYNAHRGGKAAIAELERRKRTEDNLKNIIVTPDLDIGV